MIPVSRVIPGALEAVVRKAPLTPEKVAFAWRVTVGPAIDRATTVTLRDATLHIHARDRAWRREVERALGLIRPRLVALLGDDVVRRIQVEVG